MYGGQEVRAIMRYIADGQILDVLRLLFKASPVQQRFRANPPGKRDVVAGVVGATAPVGRSPPQAAPPITDVIE